MGFGVGLLLNCVGVIREFLRPISVEASEWFRQRDELNCVGVIGVFFRPISIEASEWFRQRDACNWYAWFFTNFWTLVIIFYYVFLSIMDWLDFL